jgi:hypothetical protein
MPPARQRIITTLLSCEDMMRAVSLEGCVSKVLDI